MRTAEAISHGAITIVNAMATGKGAALGIQLWTKARVTLTDDIGHIHARIIGDADVLGEGTSLMSTTVRTILRKFPARKYGAIVETESNIPIAVGLKSSSAASDAIAAATLAALGHKTDGIESVRLGVRSSLKAGVTLTGAFDDACACHFGGLMITDNRTCKILKRFRPSPHRTYVLLHVPKAKKYSGDMRQSSFKGIERFVDLAHHEALRGNYLLSLTLNGIAYSSIFGYDLSPVTDALHAGAVAAGLSGKGPAIAAIVPDRKVEAVISAWKSYPGRIIETTFNLKKATARVLN
jgi:shikimate kinase